MFSIWDAKVFFVSKTFSIWFFIGAILSVIACSAISFIVSVLRDWY